MIGRKLAHKLGLTRDYVREASETLYETAVVTSKEQTREYRMSHEPFGGPSRVEDHYKIMLEGPVNFELDDERLYKSLEKGHKVKVAYKVIHNSVYDYVPPNF